MSTKSMKRNMSINQRDNRLVLTKLSTNYNKVEKEGNMQDNQRIVAEFTQNTLRERVSTTWFEKNKAERSIVNTNKALAKKVYSKELRNEYISIIAKSNPRFNIVLKLAEYR